MVLPAAPGAPPVTDRHGAPRSLTEIHRSVAVPLGAGWLRRLLAFIGPGYMVAVGYMDPGN